MSDVLTIGARLEALIGKDQRKKAVAATWLDAWNSSNPPKQFSSETVASQLSRVLKSDPEGVRFLFGDDMRRAATWAAFPAATAAQRAAIEQLAHDVLEGRDFRVIVDLSSGPTDPAHVPVLLAAVREELLTDGAAGPAVVLVSAKQYDFVPRSFDEIRARIRVHCVQDEQERKSYLDAAPHALIVSTNPTDAPYERWSALEFVWVRDSNARRGFGEEPPARPTVAIVPEDALTAFARDDILDGLPLVTRPLRQLGEPDESSLPTSDAGELRALMLRLATGEPITRSSYDGSTIAIGRRLAWAQALNVDASATQKEWREMLPRRLEPATIVPIEWERHLHAMTRFGLTGAFAFIAEDSVRIVNAPPEVRIASLEIRPPGSWMSPPIGSTFFVTSSPKRTR